MSRRGSKPIAQRGCYAGLEKEVGRAIALPLYIIWGATTVIVKITPSPAAITAAVKKLPRLKPLSVIKHLRMFALLKGRITGPPLPEVGRLVGINRDPALDT